MTTLFLGDSIAVGLAIAASCMSPQCDRAAVTGISTPQMIRHAPARSYDLAFISAGSNDMPQPQLRINLGRNLFALRAKVHARRVVWVLPLHPYAAARVVEVAAYYGDDVQGFTKSNDGVHPKNYHSLWRDIRETIDG